MKKLHLFMLKSFVGPFVATFFISMFVLIMQFLWRYIDDLVGKGLEGHVISELLFYVSLTLVPMGLPLAVLLASIMTFGSLGENYGVESGGYFPVPDYETVDRADRYFYDCGLLFFQQCSSLR